MFNSDELPDEMYIEKDKVVFKIHTKGHFEYDPLRYVNGSVSCVSTFTHDKDVFSRCLDLIMSDIDEHKWALFYRIPKKSHDKGLKLLHTDNDVHSFFDVAVKNGFIHLYVAHKKQNLRKYYYKNMEWEEDDAGLRKRKKSLVNGSNKGKENVFEDEGADKKRKKTFVTGGSKGKEKVFKDEGNQGVVTIYKRVVVNGKAKLVKVEGAVKTGSDRGVVIGGKEKVVKGHRI
nr:pentatricopeptide repeat-containing protein [Tanacetum cinerariifolium]